MAESKTQEQTESQIRQTWKINSLCIIHSRTDNKWYEAKIEKIYTPRADDSKEPELGNEWMTVRYKKGKISKKIQRNCEDIKPLPADHVMNLKKGSVCLIYSNIIKLWCEGKVVSVFSDNDGEWLKIKYWDTNEHKLCDIQRFSKELQTFKRHLLWTPIREYPKPNKPWMILETNNLILPPKLSNIVALNANEFITAAYSIEEEMEMNSAEIDTDSDEREKNGIYKYSLVQNRWELWIVYPKDFFSQYHNICVDYDKSVIYMFSGVGGGFVWKVQIKTRKFECLGLGGIECFGAMTYVMNGVLNIFYGNKNAKHICYDQRSKKMETIHEFEDLEKGLVSFGMVYHKSENYFLFFGGYKGKNMGRTDAIWKYSPGKSSEKWEQFSVRMPDQMQSFGSVITENGKYVLIFGGSNSEGLSDKIYILDLWTMQWRLSKSVCPFQGIGYGNVTIGKDESDGKEYIHLLQAMYSHIKIALSDVLQV